MVTAALLVAVLGSPGKLVWNDEFSGTSLDSRKWEAPRNDRQGSQSRWDPAYVSVKGGNLVLKVERHDSGEPRYTCGAVRTRANWDPAQTKFQKAFGRFEARARLPRNLRTDVWFAFWIMAGDIRDNQTDSREGTEIDIMESFFAWDGKISQAIHWGGYGPTLNSHGWPGTEVTGLAKGGFHNYALEWTPTEYRFFIDNRLVARTDAKGLGKPERTLSKGVCRQPGYLKLTAEAAKWAGPTPDWETEGPKVDEVLVDWVRVWEL